MADQRVRTSERLWSAECALAEAASISGPTETAQAIANINFRRAYPFAYEFSNGRCFADGPKPTGDGE